MSTPANNDVAPPVFTKKQAGLLTKILCHGQDKNKEETT